MVSFAKKPFYKDHAVRESIIYGEALELDKDFSESSFDVVVSRETVKYIVGLESGEGGHNYSCLEAGEDRNAKIKIDLCSPEGVDYESKKALARERFTKLFSQINRLLRPGGEFRFDISGWGIDLSPENYLQTTRDLLSGINSNIEMRRGDETRGDEGHFFIYKKPLPSHSATAVSK